MGRRVVRVLLTPAVLPFLMENNKTYTVTEGLPPETEFVGSAFDPNTFLAVMLFTHPSFREIKDGEEIPIFYPQVRQMVQG